MIKLQIRRKTAKVWQHFITDGKDFIFSKCYCKTNGDKFRVVEDGGTAKNEYNYDEIEVYDDLNSGGAETFTNSLELMERLSALQYVGFNKDGDVIIADLISSDSSNAVVEGTDGKLFVPESSGGASTFIELTDTPSNYTGQAGKAVVVNDDEDALGFVDFPESSNDLYKSWFSYTARNDIAGIFSVNNQALVATGTQTLVGVFGTTKLGSIPLQNYVGATTAGAVAGLKQANTSDCYMRQGYDAYFIFANNDTNSNHQTIVGFTSLFPNFPNVDISAYTGDFQGVGNDVGDTNLSFYCKRITATASYVKVPLGSGFPAHTTTDAYLLRLEAPQTDVATDQYIKMTIVNLITGVTATHTFTHLECPALSQALSTTTQRSNRNTGASAVFRFGKVHVTRKIY